MSKVIHHTQNAPEPVGPYSQAVEIDRTIYCSGQISIDPKTGEVFTGDVQKQTEMVMENVKSVLHAADLTLDNVVKTMIFLQDMGDFTSVNEVYAKYFPENPPARSCVQAAALPKDVAVEIEVIARRF